MRKGTVLVATALAALVALPAAYAYRKPRYLEKVTIMEAFNIPGRAFASKCVSIRVSTVNPRYAMLTAPRRVPKGCSVGDGWVFFRRATAKSLVWKDIFEGSSDPPCTVPRAVRIDLLGFSACA